MNPKIIKVARKKLKGRATLLISLVVLTIAFVLFSLKVSLKIDEVITGIIFGGLFTLLGAWIGAKKTADYSYQFDVKKRKEDEIEEQNAMITALFIETKENLQLRQKGSNRGDKAMFADEAWSVYKTKIYTLPSKLQNLLIIAYNEVKIFNSILTYDISNRNYHDNGNTGFLTTRLSGETFENHSASNDYDLNTQAQKVSRAFEKVKKEFNLLKGIKKHKLVIEATELEKGIVTV